MRKPLRFIVLSVILTGLICLEQESAGRPESAPEPASLPELVRAVDFVATVPAPTGAPTDSLYLLGGPGVLSGKFEDALGQPDRQGWIGVDVHQPLESNWQVDTFNAADLDPDTPDNHAWWCGDVLESCSETDPPEGYGPNWLEYLDWYGTVPDPNQDATVRIQAMLSYDIEPGEEYFHLLVDDNTDYMVSIDYFSGRDSAVTVDLSTVVPKEHFVGDAGDQIHLRWRFASDGAWDDADCRWPTAGAIQIDQIQVHFDQGSGPVQIGWTETCEAGVPLQWQPTLPQGPGDFSKVWPLLDDQDPDSSNDTPQFAFIDDGEVVPGTGGYLCTTWCYGPGGYIVNPEMGLSTLYQYLENEIHSPVIAVPGGGWDSALFAFDEYVHAEIHQGGAYIFGMWHVRSTADPTGLTGWSDWQDYNLVFYGDAHYTRRIHNVTDLLVPGFTHVQLALGAINLYWYSSITDGTPAPYYDNVSFQVYKHVAPSSVLVRADGSGDYPTIQAGINAVADGDTVLLADGVFTGEGNRDLYWWGKDITVCSQSGNPADCILDVEGAPGANHRGILFNYDEGPDAVLAGVTITGGYLEGTTSTTLYSGGAVICSGGSAPTISNCIFRDNSAPSSEQQGGAVFCYNANPVISDCVFDGNLAYHGGAIGASATSSPVIRNCLFTGNEALTFGGAIVAYRSNAHITIESCTFAGNINRAVTGALVSYQNGRFDVDRSIIAFNTAGYAATSTDTTDFHFTCTDIYGNTVGDWYGYFANQLWSLGNINYDPLFCGEVNPTVPYGLNEDSPCRPTYNPSCGLIGYSPVACGDWSGADQMPAPAAATRLLPCSPNPFNPRTTVSFYLAEPGPVTVRIYGLDGALVRTLVDESRTAGWHRVPWNGLDTGGRAAASGVYLCRLVSGAVAESSRMVLLR